jgi:hypothetical protein
MKYLIAACEAVDEAAEKYQRSQLDSTLFALTAISSIFLPAQFLTGYVQSDYESCIQPNRAGSSILIQDIPSFLAFICIVSGE